MMIACLIYVFFGIGLFLLGANSERIRNERALQRAIALYLRGFVAVALVGLGGILLTQVLLPVMAPVNVTLFTMANCLAPAVAIVMLAFVSKHMLTAMKRVPKSERDERIDRTKRAHATNQQLKQSATALRKRRRHGRPLRAVLKPEHRVAR